MKKDWIIDILALIGGALLVAGVYLRFGLAWALMSAGILLIGLALKAASIAERAHVSDVQ